MQIIANDLKKGDVLDDERDGAVSISEVWPNRGDGLGVVAKGQKIADGSRYFRRFLNPNEPVVVTARNL